MRLLLLQLLLVSFATPLLAQTQLKCTKVFQPSKDLALSRVLDQKMDGDFFKSILEGKNPDFTAQLLPNLAPILNQGSRGFCHMYSLYAELVREYKSRHDGKDPQISIYYWALHHWLRNALETSIDSKAGKTIVEGSWYELTFDLLKKVGVMTQEQWHQLNGQVDIEVKVKDFLEKGQLDNLMAQSHFEIEVFDTLLKDNFESTAERQKYFQSIFFKPDETNSYVRDEFKRIVDGKKKALKSGKTAFTQEQVNFLEDLAKGKNRLAKLSHEDIVNMKAALKTDIQSEVRRVFASMFFGKSEIPESVMDFTKNKALSEDLFPEVKQTTVTVVGLDSIKKGPLLQLYKKQPNDHVILVASRETFLQALVSEIEVEKNSVWLAYDHNGNFVDNKTGVMSMEGFQFSPNTPYLSRNKRNLLIPKDYEPGGHAVQLVGTVRKRATPAQEAAGQPGDLIGFVMQNSWGVEAGTQGFYFMNLDYFKAFSFKYTLRDEKGVFKKTAESPQ